MWILWAGDSEYPQRNKYGVTVRLGGSDLSSALRSRHDPGESGVEMSFNHPHSKHRVHSSRLPVRCSWPNHVSIVREAHSGAQRASLSVEDRAGPHGAEDGEWEGSSVTSGSEKTREASV